MTATNRVVPQWIVGRATNARFLMNDFRLRLFPAKDFVGRIDVYGNVPDGDGSIVIYASCDQTYLEQFAAAFVRSSILSNPTARIHLHIIDPAPITLKKIDEWRARFPALSFTFEAPLLHSFPPQFRRCYYASIRFIRLLDIIRACRSPVFCFDVDTIIRGNLEAILATEPTADVLLPLSLDSHDFRSKITLGALFLRRTEQTSNFVFCLASRLQRHLNSKTPTWGIDRECIYYTLYESNVSYRKLPTTYLDLECESEGLVWSATSDRSLAGKFSEALLSLRSKDSNEELDFML